LNPYIRTGYSNKKEFIKGLLERYNNRLEFSYVLMISEMFSDEECVNGDLEALVACIVNVNAVEKEAEVKYNQFKIELESNK